MTSRKRSISKLDTTKEEVIEETKKIKIEGDSIRTPRDPNLTLADIIQRIATNKKCRNNLIDLAIKDFKKKLKNASTESIIYHLVDENDYDGIPGFMDIEDDLFLDL